MSGINGKGYGSNHNWKDHGTEQIQDPRQRSTLWICKDCSVAFRHYYHNTPNIYEAIELSGVSDECKKVEI